MRSWLVVALAGCASQPAPSPAAPSTPVAVPGQEHNAQLMPPSIVEGHRIKGSSLIVPDDMDRWKMVERKLTRVMHSSKLCIAIDGHVGSVTMLQSSGLPGFDAKIRKRISGWEYAPFQINGKPAPVCTAVTVIYNQPLPR